MENSILLPTVPKLFLEKKKWTLPSFWKTPSVVRDSLAVTRLWRGLFPTYFFPNSRSRFQNAMYPPLSRFNSKIFPVKVEVEDLNIVFLA